ncbi:MAG: hypothetical protein M3Y39_12905, partial [Chloroflexota bacterium]|nr:hypothetical protein [Chloroflexota bacterium]
GHTHPWFSSSPGGSSTGGHTNPKVTSTGHSKSQGCDATCGNRDKKLLADRIANERIHAQNIVALIADGASLVADLVAAGIDIATQTWGGFVIDAISVIARFGVVAADLSNLGVFHLDPTLVSVIGILKGAISIVDDIKGALELFNPLAFLQSKLKLVIAAAAPRVTDGIMEIIAGNTSYGGQIVNGIMDLHSFDAQNTEVQNYSNQQAHTMCLQDHASEPGIAC